MLRLHSWVGLLACLIFLTGNSRALDSQLGSTLEGVYAKYRQALTQQDTKGWLNLTARYRQMSLRNQIVSLGLPWPRAVFDLALKPPSSAGLKLLDATAKGPVARLCFYGKIDFGIAGEAAPENALVIWFINEGTSWKYNTIQYANLNADPQLKQRASSGDLTFLNQPEFAFPTGAPVVPAPCDPPYHVSMLNVIAKGCRATVTVNGLEEAFDASTARRVVIGGLRKGPNKVRINATPAPGIDPGKMELSVEITTASGQPANPQTRVLQWKLEPGKSTLPHEITLWGASKTVVGP